MNTKSKQLHVEDPLDELITITQEEAMEIFGEDLRESLENGIFDSHPGEIFWDGQTHRRVDEEGQT